MSGPETSGHARELESARERELDALLEQEFAGEPPVMAILQRAEAGAVGALQHPVRSWLTAALVLLGIGVAVALAWNERAAGGDHQSATPQDPTSVDDTWPADVPRIYSFDKMSTVPDTAQHLSLSMPLAAARDLSRLRNLRQLAIALTVKSMVKVVKTGGSAKPGERLDVLATAKGLRRLSISGTLMGPDDFAALRHLEQLQVLELGVLIELTDEFIAEANKGGRVVGRPFDREMGEAVAKFSRAKTLVLRGMEVTVEGVRALAGAELHSLILDRPFKMTAEAMQAIGELTSLRRLELHATHAASVGANDGGRMALGGVRVLSREVMRSLAALPVLDSLTCNLCYLDRDVVASLPKNLQQLDLTGCFGVGAGLVDVVASMPELQVVGLPLQMKDGRDFMSMMRPPLEGGALHTQRLSGEQAASIIGSRVWRGLRLDGQLTKAVADELSNQAALQTMRLTPTAGSVPLAFVSSLPKLAAVTFIHTGVSEEMLQPLNDCQSLRAVVFDTCLVGGTKATGRLGLRSDLEVRWGYRSAW